MNSLPRITVITPSYNQGHLIERTILSVLNQGYPNLEYIVIDGASTDNTVDVLRKYDGLLTWISETDRGQSHAINKGFRMATGEIVTFLNSDDLFLPGSLLAVGRFFLAKPGVNWVTGRCRIIDENDREIRKGITCYKNIWLRVGTYSALQITNFISQMATFWRKQVIEHVGELNEDLHYVMDYDYWLRIGRHYKLHVINEYLACFRVHSASKSSTSISRSMEVANAQFDEEIQTARLYSDSRFLIKLHKFHNSLIVATYRHQLKRSVVSPKN